MVNVAGYYNQYDLSDTKNISLFTSRFSTGLILLVCIKGFKC